MDQPGSLFRENRRPAVLVVDDMASNLELMEAVFRGAGYAVHTALKASAAFSIFEAHRIDIALLDVMMPGTNGFELCRMLKLHSPRSFFPVVLVTALGDREVRIAGLESGADDFINKPVDIAELLARMRSLLRLKELHEELDHSENIIFSLIVAMEARDEYTKGHSTRVGDLAKEFGMFLGFPKEDQSLLAKAGMLHDIGKIGLSEVILRKPEVLTQEEAVMIRRHPLLGEEICRPLHSLRAVLPAVRSHHERWDGRGFPDGLSGEDIPLMARILAVADSFDAMVSSRPYCRAMTAERVLTVMEQERFSGQWDPNIVGEFIRMMSPVVDREPIVA